MPSKEAPRAAVTSKFSATHHCQSITLSTLHPLGEEDDGITFRARRIGTPEFENLLPSGFLNKSVSIDIGHDATLTGGSVYLIAQAEDRPLADSLGLTALEAEFFIDPALGFLNDLTSLPIKVLLRAEAKVTLGANSKPRR